MTPMTGQPAEILLVEDNPGDVRLIEEALHDGHIANNLTVAMDGVEAMSRLRDGLGDRNVRPDLVLLDLNLPRKDGRQVLEELKNDPDLHLIPVVVLTTSSAEEDILRSYELHCNAYVTKPLDVDEFLHAVRALESFWLQVVRLPNGRER